MTAWSNPDAAQAMHYRDRCNDLQAQLDRATAQLDGLALADRFAAAVRAHLLDESNGDVGRFADLLAAVLDVDPARCMVGLGRTRIALDLWPTPIRPQMVTGDASCPVGVCPHLATSHEPDDHATDGTPVRPICTIDPCPCGSEWRNP